MKATERAQEVLQHALQLCRKEGHPEITACHVATSIFERNEEVARLILENLKISGNALLVDLRAALGDLPKVTGGGEPGPGASFHQLVDDGEKAALDLGDQYLSVEHLLLACSVTKQPSVERIFKRHQLNQAKLKQALVAVRGGQKVTDANPENKLNVLDKYTKDLTQLARENKLDPVIGRDTEIRRVVQILSRRTKNNPVLIGEPGVGKTAIAEGLAQRIIKEDVPENLKDRRVLSLDLGSILAGAKYRGEFEERLKSVLKAVQDAMGNIVLFIDEIHTIVKAGGAEGAMDAGNMLKPALARGELRCIGATTLDEYKIIEKDPALERRFQPVMVLPPSVEDTVTILRGLKERYEIHHGVRIKDDALIAAATLSDRYIADRFLPDKAIDLIDEAASRLKIQLHSVPEALDNTERKIIQLKIEKAALSKETDPSAQARAQVTAANIATLEAEAAGLRAQWQASKQNVKGTNELKKQIEALRLQMQNLERLQDYGRASEIKFGTLPKLERELELSYHKNPSDKSASVTLKEEVDAEDVAAVVSTWTGIPVKKLFTAEKEKLLRLEDELRQSVVGQEQALIAVADAVRLSRSGLKDPGRPMGSFLFLGPTGVGKTETAKTLARTLFESEKSMIRIDMSEYMEEHTVAKLIGAPPGYIGHEEGGQLTEAVRRRPYCVILFDEIEKAHPRVLNVLLQLLDDGRLTDSHGRTVSFQNTLVILTSNIGAHEILKAQDSGLDEEALKDVIMKEVLSFLRPEFINRIDETIVFHALGKAALRQIVDIQLDRLNKRLGHQKITLSSTDAAKDLLAEKGWDPHFGARPLRRAIQEWVEVPLSKKILSAELVEGSTLQMDAKGGRLVFEKPSP